VLRLNNVNHFQALPLTEQFLEGSDYRPAGEPPPDEGFEPVFGVVVDVEKP
jgi:hypothetical protein